jgi:hypothetical protein
MRAVIQELGSWKHAVSGGGDTTIGSLAEDAPLGGVRHRGAIPSTLRAAAGAGVGGEATASPG